MYSTLLTCGLVAMTVMMLIGVWDDMKDIGYSSGDGGTLMLGALMTVLLFYTMSSQENCYKLDSKGICLGAFSLAVLCIPVFDTLRVMSLRMMRGKSPFRPDKTHLHHLFIDMGFGHLGAALFILMISTMVVLVWLASWKLDASIEAHASYYVCRRKPVRA